MEFDKRDYFREQADPTVPGFTVVETDESEGYRVAEKWERSDGDNRWTAYWLSEDDLRDRLDSDKCEHVGQLSDRQFAQVCEQVDERLLPVEA